MLRYTMKSPFSPFSTAFGSLGVNDSTNSFTNGFVSNFGWRRMRSSSVFDGVWFFSVCSSS